MKMPENMTCWPPFPRQRNKASGQSLRLQWRTFAADIMAVRLQNSNRRNDVRHYRLVHSWPSWLRRTKRQQSRLYNERVYRHTDTDSIVCFNKRFAAKKAGVEDGKKSIINVRRSSICWRGRRTDNGRQKTRNHGYDVIVGGELFTDYSDHPQTCHAKPKLKSTGAGRRIGLLSRWWDAYRKQLGLKDFSRKVRTLWHCSRLRSVALYLWLIVVISVIVQSTVAAISGLHCRALVMVSSSIRLTAWLQNSKKRAERSERLMYEQSHRDYLRSGYLHHRLPVMGC